MIRYHIIIGIFAFFMVQHCGGAPQVEMKHEDAAVLERKAEGGDAAAASELAERYSRGEGRTMIDYGKVYMWAKKAAEAGDARGQRLLGSCYRLGVGGVEKDVEEAAELYKRAAEGGNVDAMEALALCYSKGEGVPKDESLAIQWTKRAAEGGSVPAQYRLGIMYAQGHTCVPKDATVAKQWLEKAAAQGHREAVTALVTLMFSEEEADGQKELEEAAAKGNVLFEEKKGIEKGTGYTHEAAVEDAQKRTLVLHSEGGMSVTQQSVTQEGSFEYHVTTLKKNDSQIEEKNIRFVSKVNYKDGYANNDYVVLTNNGGDIEELAWLVIDIQKCRATEFQIPIQEINKTEVFHYTQARYITTTGGCFQRKLVVWHQNDWGSGEQVIGLRLGDSIPNRCRILWEYDARADRCFLKETVVKRNGEDSSWTSHTKVTGEEKIKKTVVPVTSDSILYQRK